MAEFDFRVDGLRQLERNWLTLARDLGPQRARTVANQPLRRALQPVEDEIRRNTPVDSGGLQRSVRTNAGRARRSEVGRAFTNNDVAVGRTGWFWQGRSLWFQALAVEYGTRHQAPLSILRNALSNNAQRAIQIFAREMGSRIERRASQLARTGRRN